MLQLVLDKISFNDRVKTSGTVEDLSIRNGVSLNNTSLATLKYDSSLPDIRCIINMEVMMMMMMMIER